MRSFDDIIKEMHGQLRRFIDRLIDVPDQVNTEHKAMYDSYIIRCQSLSYIIHVYDLIQVVT